MFFILGDNIAMSGEGVCHFFFGIFGGKKDNTYICEIKIVSNEQ